MEKISKKIFQYVKGEGLLADSDRVLLGVSGGADSVCLFSLCQKLQKEIDFQIFVIYVDHGIRGEESRRDGNFVKDLCNRYEIPFSSVSVDAISYSKKNHLSLEEAARMLRYGAFSEEAERLHCNKIATAHNANDNAETILFRLARGTGVTGLMGIPAKRHLDTENLPENTNEDDATELAIIRPLLCLTRNEIEEYLFVTGLSFVTDSTNASDDYARNQIRHTVIPALEKINAGAIAHINEAGKKVGELRALYEEALEIPGKDEKVPDDNQMIGTSLNDLSRKNVKPYLAIKELRQMSEPLRREMIHQWLYDNDAAHNVTSAHIEMISYIANAGVGKEYHLSHGYYVKNDYEFLRLYQDSQKKTSDISYEEILIPRLEFGEHMSIALKEGDLRISVGDIDGVDTKNIQKNYAKYFDYDKIKGDLLLRHRLEGDYIVIHPDGRQKKLKEYFIEEKIPSDIRGDLWILCEKSKVLYVLGYRTSEDLRVDEGTDRVLKVEFFRKG